LSSDQKRNKKSNILRWLPGVLISAIALYALFRLIHLQDFKQAFATATWQYLLVVVLIQTSSLLVRGKAWQTILGHNVTWKQAFFGISEGYFLNNIFPLRAGEIARSVFIGKSSGLGMFHVLSTIIIERVFDVAYAVLLVLITLPMVVGVAWVKTVATTVSILVAVALVMLFLVARFRVKVSAWIEKLGRHWKWVAKYVVPQLEKLMDGLSALTNPVQFLLSLFWIGLAWAMWVGMYWFLVQQILPGAPLWKGAFLSGVLSLGVAIPSAPAALGVYEASMVAALVIIGGSESVALAYAVLQHGIQFIISAIFGIWGLIREGQSLSTLMQNIHRGEAEKESVEESK
jgi:uncharacterized protein (TIRG00374 family)